VAGRWHTWPAGRIFPATLAYDTSLLTTETASRAGIAPGDGCAAALVQHSPVKLAGYAAAIVVGLLLLLFALLLRRRWRRTPAPSATSPPPVDGPPSAAPSLS
jgi:hypothetical protein